jgi:PucR family transcriptional regulator, proline-responsive transcriptional activator
LLENRIENKTIIKERLRSCSLASSTHISVLVIDISNFELKQSVDSKYLNSNLLSLFPMSNSIYYEGDIVILNEGEGIGESHNKIERVRKFLKENNLKMGVSSVFSSIEDCRIYYYQARHSLEIGGILEAEKCICLYEDIQPYSFIYKAEAQLQKEDFYNNSLYVLKKHDEKNSTELYQTLYVYLKNNHSMTRAAEELFIHRNTLRYRLEKIVELIGIDLDENDNSFKLYYAYKSMDFYKKLKSVQQKDA